MENTYLRYLILLLLVIMPNPLVYGQDKASTDNATPLHDKYGRWVKLGEPVNEFPICYQLWRCSKSHMGENQEIIKNKLPSGEWGLCENYLSPSPDNPTFCSACDAPQPQKLCY